VPDAQARAEAAAPEIEKKHFSNVSALLHLVFKVTVESYF
jgi:hypothetical protein